MRAHSPETPGAPARPQKKAKIVAPRSPASAEEPITTIKFLEITDPADRAQAHRTGSLVRVSTDLIWFLPTNRGGCGLSPYHAHEVAASCLAHKTKKGRYRHVDLVEIPAAMRDKIMKVNQTLCDSEALMPKFSPHGKYVCLSKTHFCHAHKLAKDGNRVLFNQTVPIAWQKDDPEGWAIMNDGPECCIYREDLMYDAEAMTALGNDDNLDAAICWGEDEMQAFGRIDIIFCKLAPSQDVVPKLNIMLNELNRAGLGNFPEKSWKDMCALRYKLSTASADVLKNCQFLIVASQRRVRSDDFEMVSRLGVGCL